MIRATRVPRIFRTIGLNEKTDGRGLLPALAALVALTHPLKFRTPPCPNGALSGISGGSLPKVAVDTPSNGDSVSS